MKNSFLIISIISLSIACNAQQPITKIVSEQVKLAGVTYKLEKPSIKLTKVINSDNKLAKVRQVAPNLPQGNLMPGFMKVDVKLLKQICANALPLSTLKALPKGMNDYIYKYMKIDTKGYPL